MAPIHGSSGIPNSLDAPGAARAGIEGGVRSFAAAAQAVASDGARGQVSATGLVDALEARNTVAAAARVLRTADQMLGTLLDVRA